MGSVLQKANPLANFEMQNPVVVDPAPKPAKDPREKHRPIPKEENIQLRCAAYMRREYPDVLFSSDAAGYIKLTKEQGIRMKRLNGSRGRPDMSVDYPSRGYHGLRIELKAEGTVIYKKDGSLRKQKVRKKLRNQKTGKVYIIEYDHLQEQADMLIKYNELGYLGRFVIGYDKFVQLIDWYMDRKTKLEMDSIF
jgi:hypothetical protein